MNNHLIAEYYHKISPGSVSVNVNEIPLFLFVLWDILFFRSCHLYVKVILQLIVLVNYENMNSNGIFSHIVKLF